MPDKSSRRGYHHGNLRQALVEAALDLVVEKGPQGFTMAEAARRAEVSPAAPYRHFKNQQDILSEAARQGFLIFADKLKEASNSAGPDPLRAFEALLHLLILFHLRLFGQQLISFWCRLSM